MRIAVVTTYPPGGGSLNEYAYHFVQHLRLKAETSEVVLLVDELPTGVYYTTSGEGVAVRVVPCWRFGDTHNALRIRNAVRSAHPDVVLFNIQFATFGREKVAAALGLMAPALVRLDGFVTIVLLHNIMETVNLAQAGFGRNPILQAVTRLFGHFATRTLLCADLVVLTIPRYVEILERKYHAHNVLLAPHGAFEQAPLPPEPQANPLQIMAFGKFGTYKRVEVLLEAYRLLQRTMETPLELVIAGTNSPNAPGYLETLRERYAEVAGIRFTGYVAEEDVSILFGDAAVVVFPYTSTTGSSGVLHQAGNYGKAVVLPQLGDLADLIAEEGYTGSFFEPEDPQSLADAIRTLLINPVLRADMGRQNYLAACGLPMGDVVDWYLLHAQQIAAQRRGVARATV